MSDINVGDLRTNNSGDTFIVTNYKNCLVVDIEFIKSGYKTKVRSDRIRDGNIKDRLKPFVSGVGFFGDGDFNSKHPSYKIWCGMLERCHGEHSHKHHPNYIGCTVCEEWHNFQNFAKWWDENHPNDGEKYQVDKDIKVKGNKVYSPSTCMFATRADNMIEAKAKHYKFINPEGDLVEIYNLMAFCRETDLNHGAMVQVGLGKYKHYKGWTVAKSV